MMRGVRLACRFGFEIEPETEQAIRAHAKELFLASKPASPREKQWGAFWKKLMKSQSMNNSMSQARSSSA
jgi:tRNA nucleotidyltransferase/poly(A) polymerase